MRRVGGVLDAGDFPLRGSAVGVALVLVLTGLTSGAVAVTPPAGPPVGAAVGPPPSGALCTGPALQPSYVGSLVVDGNVPRPTVANRTIAVSYYYSENYSPTHGTPSLSCTGDRAEAITDALGGFSLALPIPSNLCNSLGCSYFFGPFAPGIFSVVNGTPAGYLVSSHVSGSTLSMAYVEALATVTTSPGSRITLSALAPTTVRAFAQSGNGSATPATVGYAWSISGSGWIAQSGTGTPNLTIFAESNAGPGELALWVNGTFNGTVVTAPEATLFLAAAPTTIAAGSVVPTSLDVGVSTVFTIAGSGAVGYSYTSSVFPGLGQPNVSAPCEETGISGALVDVTCSVSFVYAAVGTTQPSANLSNGYSTATFQFQPVTVEPALGVSVTPAPFSAYVGSPTSLFVGVLPETGTSPFGPACVYSGNGQTVCDSPSAGPFGFSLAYGSPGVYEGRATVVDRSGANASVGFSATIVEHPVLNGLHELTQQIPQVGENLTVTDQLAGGAFPASYWWNESPSGGTLFAGTLFTAGSLVDTFVPRLAGELIVNLTVIDRLGTSVHDLLVLYVNGTGPTTLDPVGGGGNWTTLAGVPYGLDWVADSPGGIADTAYWTPVVITPLLPPLGSHSVPVWINSTRGPVPPSASGTYTLQQGDWQNGELEFTLDVGGVVLVEFNFTSAIPITELVHGNRFLKILPDVAHESLSHPEFVEPGARTNHTLWQITDEWGDAVPLGGYVLVETYFAGAIPGESRSLIETVNGTSEVWVNYSAPTSSNGTVLVVNPNDPQRPLWEIAVPGAASSGVPTWTYLLALAAAVGLLLAAFVVHRRRGVSPAEPPSTGPERYEASEEELRRVAEGRAHVLLRSETDLGHTLDEFAQGFHGRPPTPEELTEWVASLVADGSLRTALGDDGRSRFFRTGSATPVAAPRVELDDAALEAALRQRSSEEDDDEVPPPGGA